MKYIVGVFPLPEGSRPVYLTALPCPNNVAGDPWWTGNLEQAHRFGSTREALQAIESYGRVNHGNPYPRNWTLLREFVTAVDVS